MAFNFMIALVLAYTAGGMLQPRPRVAWQLLIRGELCWATTCTSLTILGVRFGGLVLNVWALDHVQYAMGHTRAIKMKPKTINAAYG